MQELVPVSLSMKCYVQKLTFHGSPPHSPALIFFSNPLLPYSLNLVSDKVDVHSPSTEENFHFLILIT